jgi:hypothetical protein
MATDVHLALLVGGSRDGETKTVGRPTSAGSSPPPTLPACWESTA